MVVLDRFFFSFGDKKKWSLVALDRWLSYTVTVVWEIAWVDSALIALDEWSSYRGGRLNRFDCTKLENLLSISLESEQKQGRE